MSVHCLISVRGSAAVPGVLPPNETGELLHALEYSALRRSRAGARHVLSHPAVARVAKDQRLLGIACEVLGPEAFAFRATLFDKSPTANWLVAWHQDTALPLRERRETAGWGPWSVKDGVHYAHAPATALEQVLALRLHLDDSTLENGPLRVLPGTHTLGVLSDEAIHGIASASAAGPEDCLIDAGGIVAMRPLVIHASSKSRTEMPRRVLHIEYAAHERIAGELEIAVDGKR